MRDPGFKGMEAINFEDPLERTRQIAHRATIMNQMQAEIYVLQYREYGGEMRR